MKRSRMLWLASLAAAFVAGACFGVLLSNPAAEAAQTFGPNDVKSIPPGFIEGGSQDTTLLKKLLEAVVDQQTKLESIEKNTAATSERADQLVRQQDAANGYLRIISER